MKDLSHVLNRWQSWSWPRTFI